MNNTLNSTKYNESFGTTIEFENKLIEENRVKTIGTTLGITTALKTIMKTRASELINSSADTIRAEVAKEVRKNGFVTGAPDTTKAFENKLIKEKENAIALHENTASMAWAVRKLMSDGRNPKILSATAKTTALAIENELKAVSQAA